MAKWACAYFSQTFPLVAGTVEQQNLPRPTLGEQTHSMQDVGLKSGRRAELLILPDSYVQLVAPLLLGRSK